MSGGGDTSQSDGRPPRPAAVVLALYEAYNAHEADCAAALYAPAGTHVEVASGRSACGRAEIAFGLHGLLGAFPDAHWELELTIAQDEVVAAPYRLTGTLQTRLGPIQARGQRLDLRGIHVIHLEGGEITSSEDYWDAATFRSQMSETAERKR